MLSHTAHRSWVVGCCMEQQNLPVLQPGVSHSRQHNHTVMSLDMTKDRIHKLFRNVELSVSSYDTAWVAMVPSPNSPNSPCFPECLNWLMDNQLNNGSWGLLQHNPPFSLLKDTLSSTLASIVALRKWNVGEHQINKGLRFIESNIASVTDENQPSPIGYDIIFPHMLEYAVDLNIKLPLNQNDLSLMLHRRELELRRCHSKERAAYLAYISEGLGGFYDWKMVMKYQMKNGSILNSPSASAAALIHHQNAGCLDYLTSLLDKFGNAVPTVYPDLYVRLYMVDQLERLGVSRHFMVEIKTVLDEVYSYWLQRDEQIFMNAGTCALAFRVLRTNGYQISSDPLAEIIQDGSYMSPHEEPFEDTYAALEAYRASQIIYQDESAFGELNVLSAEFLKREISTAQSTHSKYIYKQVEDAFKFPFYAGLERVSTRRNIQNYNVDDTRTLKTTYCSSNISNEDYLRLAVEDFNSCQSIYREEFKVLERWVVENKLDKINSRQKMGYCYFSGASVLSSPELSDARIAWAKSSFLVTIVDDFFDVEGSVDELVNIIQCVEKWNVYVGIDCCSEEVRIMFLSIKDVVSWIGDKAYKWQERDVTSHVIQCRELKDGKLNAVTLHKNYGKNGIKEEEIVEEIKTWIDNLEKNLMQLVLETKESSVPKACKDVFWKMCCVDIFFYATDDGFTGNKILDTVREVIYEPVSMLMNLTE